MSKHTPGPWVVEGTKREPSIIGPENFWVAGLLCNATGHEAIAAANAELIAAAPDLLLAMKELLEANSYHFPVGNPWGDKARAAIAKAEGR